MIRLEDTTLDSHLYQMRMNGIRLRRYYERKMRENPHYRVMHRHQHLFPEVYGRRYLFTSMALGISWNGQAWVDGFDHAGVYFETEKEFAREAAIAAGAPEDATWISLEQTDYEWNKVTHCLVAANHAATVHKETSTLSN